MKIKIRILMSITIMSLCLTGCWTRRELTDMSFIFARGFDISKEGEFISTAQILDTGKPSAGAGGSSGGNRGLGYFTITSEGHSAFSTSRNGARESGRRLFAGQGRVIVVGEELARKGIFPLIDHWYRDIDVVPTANMLISKGKASNIVKMEHPAEDVPGFAIKELIEVNYATSRVATIKLYELMKSMASKTSGSYVAGIEILTREDGSSSLKLNRTAIFKKDKLIGWFSDNESRGLLWILGKVKTGDIEILSPSKTEKAPGIIALKILKQSKKKLEPKIEDGKLSITIKVNVDCQVANLTDSEININKLDTLKELEKRAERQVVKDIDEAINKGQKQFNADVFGFDNAFHRKYPKEWKELEKNWDTEFSRIYVKHEVKVRILRVGLVTSYSEEEGS